VEKHSFAAETRRELLMLPAPVEDLAMAEVNALKASMGSENEQAVGGRQ
jgi:hypothetical protein